MSTETETTAPPTPEELVEYALAHPDDDAAAEGILQLLAESELRAERAETSLARLRRQRDEFHYDWSARGGILDALLDACLRYYKPQGEITRPSGDARAERFRKAVIAAGVNSGRWRG